MIDLDILRPILHDYRSEVQKLWTPETAYGTEGAYGDPKGQCGVTSAWLQKRLRIDHELGAVYYVGRVLENGLDISGKHCWLQLGPIVVDLTGSQFGLNEVVCGHRLDLVPHYDGRPGRRPLKRLRLLEAA